MNRIQRVFTRPVRAWIYGVAFAGGAVAVGYGAMTAEQAALWIALGGAVLIPNGLALANLERDHHDPDQ